MKKRERERSKIKAVQINNFGAMIGTRTDIMRKKNNYRAER